MPTPGIRSARRQAGRLVPERRNTVVARSTKGQLDPRSSGRPRGRHRMVPLTGKGCANRDATAPRSPTSSATITSFSDRSRLHLRNESDSMSSTERPLPRPGALPAVLGPLRPTKRTAGRPNRPSIRRYRLSLAARHGRATPRIVAPSPSLTLSRSGSPRPPPGSRSRCRPGRHRGCRDTDATRSRDSRDPAMAPDRERHRWSGPN